MNVETDLMTSAEVAELLRTPEGTLRFWRATNRGPESFKIGGRVRYRRTAVQKWIAEQESATARGGAA